MKKMKPMLALLAFLPAFAASPLPAADQEMECKMCKECPMCQEKMEKMKGMEKMKDMPEGKPMPQMERMQKMQRMMQEKMQGMEPRERMELMERMQRERMEPKPPMDRGMDRERMEPRGPMERPQRERIQREGPKMPPPPMGPMDVKKRLAEMDLAATVQQYGKVRHMLEETRTELRLLEQKEGAEKETAMLSKRLEALGKLAEELRSKAEACCEMDAKKEPEEQPGAHDHGDKQKDGDKHDQPEQPEAGKPAAEPHH